MKEKRRKYIYVISGYGILINFIWKVNTKHNNSQMSIIQFS